MERDPTKGELSWTGIAGNEEFIVFDELCALSFVCWLWPTAMAEELSEQPAYPNYVGASLVVAAGRWAFASEALGGLLKTLGAVPFEHHEPDPTCEKADELTSWRRAAADGHVPKAPVPWEGEPMEYVPKAGKTPLPPICAEEMGAASTPSSASATKAVRY